MVLEHDQRVAPLSNLSECFACAGVKATDAADVGRDATKDYCEKESDDAKEIMDRTRDMRAGLHLDCRQQHCCTASAAEPAPAGQAPETTAATPAKLTHSETILGSGRLQDLDVYDCQGNKLGNLDNLIVDAHTSRVLCGILDTGIGGKLIPVPWKAFQLVKKDDQFRLSLDSSEERLKKAPTYDDSNRPDFADPKWQQRVDSFFGVQSDAWPTVAEKSQDPNVLQHEEMILESSKLGDLNVYNREEKKLGNLDNLIVDAHAGRVLYGILDTGIGGKLIPVPWNAFLVQKNRRRRRTASCWHHGGPVGQCTDLRSGPQAGLQRFAVEGHRRQVLRRAFRRPPDHAGRAEPVTLLRKRS